MEVKVKLHTLYIKDEETEKEYPIITIRSAKEIVDYIEESEREEIQNKLAYLVSKALEKS
ncbi:MAG: hypothetical protein WBF08_00580 [Candidatus Bathyarchaeia archaeon]